MSEHHASRAERLIEILDGSVIAGNPIAAASKKNSVYGPASKRAA
jgi:hypothetical protein